VEIVQVRKVDVARKRKKSRRWSPERKAEAALGILQGELTRDQVARQARVKPETVDIWVELFRSGGKTAFGQDNLGSDLVGKIPSDQWVQIELLRMRQDLLKGQRRSASDILIQIIAPIVIGLILAALWSVTVELKTRDRTHDLEQQTVNQNSHIISQDSRIKNLEADYRALKEMAKKAGQEAEKSQRAAQKENEKAINLAQLKEGLENLQEIQKLDKEMHSSMVLVAKLLQRAQEAEAESKALNNRAAELEPYVNNKDLLWLEDDTNIFSNPAALVDYDSFSNNEESSDTPTINSDIELPWLIRAFEYYWNPIKTSRCVNSVPRTIFEIERTIVKIGDGKDYYSEVYKGIPPHHRMGLTQYFAIDAASDEEESCATPTFIQLPEDVLGVEYSWNPMVTFRGGIDATQVFISDQEETAESDSGFGFNTSNVLTSSSALSPAPAVPKNNPLPFLLSSLDKEGLVPQVFENDSKYCFQYGDELIDQCTFASLRNCRKALSAISRNQAVCIPKPQQFTCFAWQNERNESSHKFTRCYSDPNKCIANWRIISRVLATDLNIEARITDGCTE